MEMKSVSHHQATQLLHNKFIVVLGDSIMRSVYKDIVMLLQRDKYLTFKQLKSKGEMSFEQDCLVEGGCLGQMHNGTEYREVRQYQSAHHLVRFYFVTRIYSRYMQSILEDFRSGLKPDVVIVNSCVWDISRYYSKWIIDYKENLHQFFEALKEILPEESLTVWNLTMPLGEGIRGGFLVPEIEHKASHLRFDVIEANFYSGTLADAYGMDVLDLHFQFRFSLQHRTKDGVHWNAIAHRRITSLLLQHAAQAWGVIMLCPMTAVENTEVPKQQQQKQKQKQQQQQQQQQPPPQQCRPAFVKAFNPPGGFHHVQANYSFPYATNTFSAIGQLRSRGSFYNGGYSEEFSSDALPFNFMNFQENNLQPQTNHNEAAAAYSRQQNRNGIEYKHPHHSEPYNELQHQSVMRSRHSRNHYAPYTHQRPKQYDRHGRYY